MAITLIEIENLRLYRELLLEPDLSLNLVTGDNASGKTTFLEALYLLGTGRSFRSGSLESLQMHGADFFRVSAHCLDYSGTSTIQLGFARGPGGRKITVNGREQDSATTLVQHLPVQLISADSHFNFVHDAKVRRAVMDWLLFHVEQDFQGLWWRYQRILQQRNAALKDGRQAKVRWAWDGELAQVGDELQARRASITGRIQPGFQSTCSALLPPSVEVGLELVPGWHADLGLASCLERDRERDQSRGFTHSGPHRNDLRILIGGLPSRDEASHGQNKLLVIALRLAQISLLIGESNRRCCLLIDDLAAELDVAHRQRLTQLLAKLPVQVFVTSTDPAQIDLSPWRTTKTFHVERGRLTGCKTA